MKNKNNPIPEPYYSFHAKSFKNKNELLSKKQIGCYYCLKNFTPLDITEWIDDDQTALCPHCGIDSVIEFIDLTFLENMKDNWF